MGAKIYATTKLIKNGRSTLLNRRVSKYSATRTSVVTILCIIHFLFNIDVLFLASSIGYLFWWFPCSCCKPKFCGAKVVKKNEICKFYIKNIKNVKKNLRLLVYLCFFYYLCRPVCYRVAFG